MSYESSFHGGASTPLPQPGSLEYINRPNPVEPSNLSHATFDGSARELDRTTNEQLHPFLLGNRLRQRNDLAPDSARLKRHLTHQSPGSSLASVLNKDDSLQLREHTSHRRDVDQALFTLPKLPVKRSAKRHRVPPVLQGLHQPPPDAGLLPSISTEESQVFLSGSRSSHTVPNTRKDTTPPVVQQDIETSTEATKDTLDKPSKRNKWTDQETEDLLQGVARFGIGSWKKILLCPDYQFHKRTAVDLKDRFRVCRPDDYGGARKTKKQKPAEEPKESIESSSTEQSKDAERQSRSDGQTLWKAQRRPRRNFTIEEDQALLKGFREQGVSWVSISKQEVFREHNRTPTDLRDRFRTKFPEQYKEAGLASRPAVPKPAKRTRATRQEKGKPTAETAPTNIANINPRDTRAKYTNDRQERTGSRIGNAYGLPLPSIGDDMLPNFGFPDDDEDADPIVLDRSIVDWANNNSSRPPQPPVTENPPFPGIDPLVTLKLPKPGLF